MFVPLISLGASPHPKGSGHQDRAYCVGPRVPKVSLVPSKQEEVLSDCG